MQGLAGLDDSVFSDEFCRFLQGSIPSVDAAEVLLALAREPQRWWHPREFGISEADAQRKERPVTLFRVIYALRDLKIKSFADAFKLKRK